MRSDRHLLDQEPIPAEPETQTELCYCVPMRNITVSVDEDTYKRARIRAAELDTSVSKLVRDFLRELATSESDFERLARQEREIAATIVGFSASDRLSRDEIHERRR